MHLIVDSGSTKTLWCLVEGSELIQEIKTLGINPYVSSKEEIFKIVAEELGGQLLEAPEAIYFYGAGCSTDTNKQIISQSLALLNASAHIEVHHDLLAVARSLCQHEPGIAVILGTGSNSCLYDGSRILQNTPSLGYIMGDEGSGAQIGKQLIADVWYQTIPDDLRADFFNEYPAELEFYLNAIYKKPAGNAFLASFTTWLAKHKSHSYVQYLLKSCFEAFLKKHIAPYGTTVSNKIHCIGSIAFYFRDEWKDVILQQGYELGKVEQMPMEGLIQYHS